MYFLTAGICDRLTLQAKYPSCHSNRALPGRSFIHRDEFRRRDLVSVSIAVNVAGVEVKCFFWEENELVLDLLPEDVDSVEKAEGIFDLMKAIAKTLNKRVLLTAENASATRQWAEEYAICAFDPPHVQP